MPRYTTHPPSAEALPVMIFVVEYTTISAPLSSGLRLRGVTVLSTINAMPCLVAMSATASKSGKRIFGLPTLSKKMIFVLSLRAASIASRSSTSKKRVLIPKRESVSLKKEYVPPKSPPILTISSPLSSKLIHANVIAPIPVLVAIAPTPPSMEAMTLSSFAEVGLPTRA